MSKHRLFCPVLVEGQNTLSEAESHHAVATLRLIEGDKVELFDGHGQIGVGVIAKASKKKLAIDISNTLVVSAPSAIRLTLAVAMPRSHRQGYLIEKCSELGVSALWPMTTDRAVAKPGVGSIDKWRRRAVEACKQSGNNWLPTIKPTLTFADLLAKLKAFDMVLLSDSCTSQEIGERLSSSENFKSLLVMIGPEGGWSDSERDQAIAAGIAPVSLAPFTLRTETAAVAVCCAVSRHNMALKD